MAFLLSHVAQIYAAQSSNFFCVCRTKRKNIRRKSEEVTGISRVKITYQMFIILCELSHLFHCITFTITAGLYIPFSLQFQVQLISNHKEKEIEQKRMPISSNFKRI